MVTFPPVTLTAQWGSHSGSMGQAAWVLNGSFGLKSLIHFKGLFCDAAAPQWWVHGREIEVACMKRTTYVSGLSCS